MTSNKGYQGTYKQDYGKPNDVQVYVKKGDKETFYTLDTCFGYVKHSPDGFNWGYSGSGAAQLAFALLMDYTGNMQITRDLYHEFKHKVISKLPKNADWVLDEDVVAIFLREHKATLWGKESEPESVYI